MTVYHASRISNLIELGIRINSPTSCSVFKKSKHVYVGTLEYILNQYLTYCPKGLYYIYEIEVDLTGFEELPAKGQWRTTQTLFPTKIIKEITK